MGSHNRKRSFKDFAETENFPGGNESSDMTKRSHKKHRGAKERSSKDEPRTEVSTKPGLHFAQHRLNSCVKLNDLRDLVLYCLADGVAPSWISIQNKSQFRKAVILFVPGLEQAMFDGTLPLAAEQNVSTDSADDKPSEGDADGAGHEDAGWTTVGKNRNTTGPDNYLPIALDEQTLPSQLKVLATVFQQLWPVQASGDSRYSKVHSPLHSMLQRSVQESLEDKSRNRNTKGAKPVKVKEDFSAKRTPITQFIASVEELQDNGYVVHPALFANDSERQHELERRERQPAESKVAWKDSNMEAASEPVRTNTTDDSADDITDGRTVYAVDCEMCMVGEDDYALTRISVLAWDGSVVMDELVKPDKPIINYLTQYSGISKEMLQDVELRLDDVQQRLLKLFTKDTILVGHSLNSDLKALQMTHPYIVDTSIIYPHPRGPPMKSSLKWLAQKYLSREIQKGHGSVGHDSAEDAKACLDLVRLKCEKGKQWGTPDAVHESIFKVLGKKPKSGQHSGVTDGREGAIVDIGNPERNFGQQAAYSIGCKDDDGIVEAVKRCVLGDPDGEYIPGGGVELIWARLRELDYLRGWANNNRAEDPRTINEEPSLAEISAAVSRTSDRIVAIRNFLPPCTLLMVYTGTGDPRELRRLQEMERQFKKEYAIKKWDELSVKWTDVEAQALKKACQVARAGIGLMCVT